MSSPYCSDANHSGFRDSGDSIPIRWRGLLWREITRFGASLLRVPESERWVSQ